MEALTQVKQDFVEHDHSHSLDDVRIMLKRIAGMHRYERSAKQKAIGLVYPRIDMEFLRWRNNKGWPRFAVFSEEHRNCFFRSESYKLCLTNCVWPNKFYLRKINTAFMGVHNPFDDVFIQLQKEREKKHLQSLTVSQTFRGYRPVAAQQAEAVAMRSGLFSGVCLVCEAGPWDKTKIIQPKGDPLLVAWSREFEQAYLIHSFDIAPIEDIVRREFSEGELTK